MKTDAKGIPQRLGWMALALVLFVVGGPPGLAKDSPSLENPTTIAEGQVGGHDDGSFKGEYGEVNYNVDVGAHGQIDIGENGVEASGQIGLAMELEALSDRFVAGDENLNASVQASAKVEALIGAEGKIGAYIDEKGITIGAEGSAGAYVSAEASVNFEMNVFGIQTNVKATAEAHAGFMAQGQALVEIGFDGRIKFHLGGGIAVGIGASVSLEFEIDASQLLEKLGLSDLATLIEWLDEFVKDPKATIDKLLSGYVDETLSGAVDGLIDTVEDSMNNLEDSIGRVGDDLWNWIGGGGSGGRGNDTGTPTSSPPGDPTDGPSKPSNPQYGSSQGNVKPPGGSSSFGSIPPQPSNGGQGVEKKPVKRNDKFETWSE